MTAAIIKQVSITVSLTAQASIVVGLRLYGPWDGEWNRIFSTSQFGSITLDNAFHIAPSVLYGIDIKHCTDGVGTITGDA
ncbi:hypothetical protein QBC41DRAFT_70516 [Cercophora samala]|uniref:Uncharacterized protein n=1 Tax=Cercophora samala TaxID=330535 RepID=A0AA40DGX6_9PEZI|nr:hypothetical protein QBC41DRAFT_70516 [Cercophora samala]